MRCALAVAAPLAAPLAVPLAVPWATAAAQGKAATWEVKRLDGAFCVEFMAPPKEAADLLPGKMVPLAAREVDSLAPIAKQAIQEQPELAAWSPGELCVIRAGTVSADGRETAEAKEGRSLYVAFVRVAAKYESGDSGAASAGGVLFADNWRIQKAGEQLLVSVGELDAKAGPAPESTDERIVLEFGKSMVTWDGHAGSDSTAVAEPWRRRVAIEGLRNLRWDALVTLQPTRRRAMIGSIRIEGKGALTKALKASPYRFVTPVFEGGEGTIALSR